MEKHPNNTNSKISKTEWKTFNAKALVAEDNPANQMLIKILLEKHGIEVTLVEDGQQAVETVQNQHFDIIFMDIQMPAMNGHEATRFLRKKGFKTPIIALTANAMTGDRKKCLEAGCDGYLAKPIDRQQLQDIIETSLSPKSPLEKQIDKLNEQSQQINQLVNEVTPTLPQATLKKDEKED